MITQHKFGIDGVCSLRLLLIIIPSPCWLPGRSFPESTNQVTSSLHHVWMTLHCTTLHLKCVNKFDCFCHCCCVFVLLFWCWFCEYEIDIILSLIVSWLLLPAHTHTHTHTHTHLGMFVELGILPRLRQQLVLLLLRSERETTIAILISSHNNTHQNSQNVNAGWLLPHQAWTWVAMHLWWSANQGRKW